jgi:hypothetical protein
MMCVQCGGTQNVWKRLKGLDHEGKPIDDGELHPTLCMSEVCRRRRGWRPAKGSTQ